MSTDETAAGVAARYAERIETEIETAPQPDVAAADYVADALDARYVMSSRGDVETVHLIVGAGGPHVELRHHVGTRWMDVHVAWWGDVADHGVHAPHLAAELDALADAWQDAYVTTDRNRTGVPAWMR